MKVTFERLVGPEYMLPAMRVTQAKDMYTNSLPTAETWIKMLLSEHSSDRSVVYRFYCEDVPYYTHVHIIRHHMGFQPHVMSQRSEEKREDLPQGSLVNMLFDANAQAIINIARKRLCYKADKTAQDLVEKMKCALVYDGDKYDQILGKVLMRPCSWFPGYCAEPHPCGRIVGVRSLFNVHQSILEEIK